MACEAEFQAMTNAALALDTSIIAMEAAAAVVNSNVAAANAAIMAYQICMDGQGGQPMMNSSKAKKKSPAEKMFKNMNQAMTAIQRWIGILKRDAEQLPRNR